MHGTKNKTICWWVFWDFTPHFHPKTRRHTRNFSGIDIAGSTRYNGKQMNLRAIDQKNKMNIRPKSYKQVQIGCTLRTKKPITIITSYHWASCWIMHYIQLCAQDILFQWIERSSSFIARTKIRSNILQLQMTELYDSDQINFQLNVQKSRMKEILKTPVALYIKSF